MRSRKAYPYKYEIACDGVHLDSKDNTITNFIHPETGVTANIENTVRDCRHNHGIAQGEVVLFHAAAVSASRWICGLLAATMPPIPCERIPSRASVAALGAATPALIASH